MQLKLRCKNARVEFAFPAFRSIYGLRQTIHVSMKASVLIKNCFNNICVLLIILLSYSFQFGYCQDDGDWHTDQSEQLIQDGPCDIVKIDESDLTQKLFMEMFAFKLPVIVSGSRRNEKFQELCRRDVILRNYGEKTIRLSSANTYSYEKKDVTLEYYVNQMMQPQSLTALANETFYWFGDNNHTEWNELFKEFVPPKVSLPGTTAVISFGIAAAGTGVPFHFHGPGFAEVIYGRKRWFVYPPDKTPNFHPNKTTLQWFHESLPELHSTLAPMQCTVHKGDYIYFPNHWWHATLNIDTSVFVSTFLS